MTVDLKELERLASAARDAAWPTSPSTPLEDNFEALAVEYIVALSPDKALALIAALRLARAALVAWRDWWPRYRRARSDVSAPR